MTGELRVDDVDVYSARNDYWSGQILKHISGASLYLQDRAQRPWGFTVVCAPDGALNAVRFDNGTVWGFCCMREGDRLHAWPQFIKDLAARNRTGVGKLWVRAERLYTDGMHVSFSSDNAYVPDILVWHYPPKPLSVIKVEGGPLA